MIKRDEEYYNRKMERREFADAVKQWKPRRSRFPRHRRGVEVRNGSFRGSIWPNTVWPALGTQEREKARRLRQIERGQLTTANGLVV